MRGLVSALWVTTTLVWVPVALWILGDVAAAFAWWAGVATVLAGAASAAVINRQEGKQP